MAAAKGRRSGRTWTLRVRACLRMRAYACVRAYACTRAQAGAHACMLAGGQW